jgi:hypothetical protein
MPLISSIDIEVSSDASQDERKRAKKFFIELKKMDEDDIAEVLLKTIAANAILYLLQAHQDRKNSRRPTKTMTKSQPARRKRV